jgi:P27 family predicted phage terminase small subunit
MGKIATGGPPSKPTKLKVIEGNKGKRRLNTKEPQPRPVAGKRPYWLREQAKRFWSRYVPILTRLGVFTEADGAAMILLAEAYADFRECLEVIKDKDKGYTFTTPSGYEAQRPEVAIMRKARKDMESLLAHFGMTPAARSRLAIDLPEDPDEFEGLLD